jgi:hypothetical protein
MNYANIYVAKLQATLKSPAIAVEMSAEFCGKVFLKTTIVLLQKLVRKKLGFKISEMGTRATWAPKTPPPTSSGQFELFSHA